MTTARDVSPMWPRDWLSTGAGSTRAADEVAAPGSTSRSIGELAVSSRPVNRLSDALATQPTCSITRLETVITITRFSTIE